MRDRALRSMMVLGLLGIAGLVATVAAAVAMDRYDSVADQLPYAVSGAMGGLAVAGFSAAVIAIQAGRRAAAAERRVLETMLRESAAWLAAVRAEGAAR